MNNPSAGSPTETLLRLSHSSDEMVHTTYKDLHMKIQRLLSEVITKTSSQLRRRAVCTKGRDVVST